MRYLFTGIMMLMGTVAFAQGSASDKAMWTQGACASEVTQLCGDITPGQGRIGDCLKAHEDKLSSGCKQQVQANIDQMHDMRRACRDDMQKFCSNVQPGGNRIFSCLSDHQDQLSSACKTETQTMKAKRSTASMSDGTPQSEPAKQQ